MGIRFSSRSDQLPDPLSIHVAHFTPSSFPLLPLISPKSNQLCKDSWRKIASFQQSEGMSGFTRFYDEFYNRLDKVDFSGEFDGVLSRNTQGKNKIFAKGSLIIRIIDYILKIDADTKELRDRLTKLGAAHIRLKIHPWQYSIFVETLLQTIASCLQEEASHDVMESWVNLFALVLKYMLPAALKGNKELSSSHCMNYTENNVSRSPGRQTSMTTSLRSSYNMNNTTHNKSNTMENHSFHHPSSTVRIKGVVEEPTDLSKPNTTDIYQKNDNVIINNDEDINNMIHIQSDSMNNNNNNNNSSSTSLLVHYTTGDNHNMNTYHSNIPTNKVFPNESLYNHDIEEVENHNRVEPKSRRFSYTNKDHISSNIIPLSKLRKLKSQNDLLSIDDDKNTKNKANIPKNKSSDYLDSLTGIYKIFSSIKTKKTNYKISQQSIESCSLYHHRPGTNESSVTTTLNTKDTPRKRHRSYDAFLNRSGSTNEFIYDINKDSKGTEDTYSIESMCTKSTSKGGIRKSFSGTILPIDSSDHQSILHDDVQYEVKYVVVDDLQRVYDIDGDNEDIEYSPTKAINNRNSILQQEEQWIEISSPTVGESKPKDFQSYSRTNSILKTAPIRASISTNSLENTFKAAGGTIVMAPLAVDCQEQSLTLSKSCPSLHDMTNTTDNMTGGYSSTTIGGIMLKRPSKPIIRNDMQKTALI